jgi:hypothetical protein
MSKSKENNARIGMRINEAILKQIQACAAVENCSATDLITRAITEYINKDTLIQPQIFGAIEALRGDIKFIDKKVELFSNLWVYWLQFYFAFTPSYSGNPEEAKAFIESSKRRRTAMLDSFRKDMKTQPKLIEMLLADYLAEDIETK